MSEFSPLAQLTACALVSGLIYLSIFTLPFPLPRFYNGIPPLDYTKLTNYSQLGFFLYTLGIITLFVVYSWAIYLTSPNETADSSQQSVVSFRFVFSSSIVFAVILIFSYPLTAIDLFIYAIRTRGWALYNLQPLATPPTLLPASDPWLGLAGEWIDAASPYGPLWELLSLATFQLSSGSFLTHLFWLKIIGAAAYLGCIWLVYILLSRLRPNWVLAGTLAFAWNPLVLFESVQNAHNDIVMGLFFLAAIWVFVHIHQLTSPPLGGIEGGLSANSGNANQQSSHPIGFSLLFCVLLALSILVKFVTVLVAPFFVLALALRYPTWPRRLAALIGYTIFISILIVVPMLPFWPGLDNWAVLQAGSGAGRSLLALLILGLRNWLGTNPAFDVSRNLILIIFGLIYLYLLWQLLKPYLSKSSSPPPPQLPIASAFFAFFWYVLLAAPVFHAWYLLWFLPLASLMLPAQRPLIASIIFSITALLIIPYFETIRVWYPYLLQNHFVGHLIGVPLLIVPPALALLWPIRPNLRSG